MPSNRPPAVRGPVLSGRVRFGVPDDYAGRYLTPVLRSFASRHSAVEIGLHCEQSTTLIPKVQRGDLDLALVSRDQSRRGVLLFDEPLVWVGAPQYEAWRRDRQLAAVESGLAVAALTRCSVPPGVLVLNEKHGLPPLGAMQVAVVRSRQSVGAAAVDALHEQMLRTLRAAPAMAG